MKRSVCVFLTLCIFLIGCGSPEEERKTEEPWQITATKPVTLKPTLSPLPENPATSTPVIPEEKTTPVADITPTSPEPATTPVITLSPTSSANALTPTPVPVKSLTPTPVPTVTCPVWDFMKIGVEPYEDETGRTVYEAATSFFDENGLFCVGLKAVCERDSELFETEKTFYLPNATIYKETKCISEAELYELFQGHVTQESHRTVVYEPIVFETIGNHVWTTGGELVETAALLGEEQRTKFVCTPEDGYIPVRGGEILRMTYHFSWFPQVGGIVFLDKQDQVVQAYSFNATTGINGREVVVPKNSVKMHLSLYANQTYRIERQTEVKGADLSLITEESYMEQSLKKMLEVSKKTVSRYSPDKAYITFVLDDCRPDMDRVVDIFQEYEVPLCVAAIHELLLFPASKGEETRQQVCERVVAGGGEVLAHDGEVITEETVGNYYELTEQFYEDKWMLEQRGFDVNGIILVGGTGQVVGHPVTDVFARAFYQYSDLYGDINAGEPYYHRRTWLKNCLDNYEQTIEKAIEEKKWLVLYFHDLGEVSTEKLREILTYVSGLEDTEAEVVTYKTLYDMMWK